MKNHLLLALLFSLLPLTASAQNSADNDNSDRSGYYNRTGADLLFGSDNSTARYFMINGYRFNQHISAGIGIGYVPYNDPLGLIPVFTDFTYNFSQSDVSPFLYLRLGYSFSKKSDDDFVMESHEGGVMINPGIGLQFETGKSWNWYLNAGFNRDRSVHSFDSWGNRTVNNRYSYRRVHIGIGVVF